VDKSATDALFSLILRRETGRLPDPIENGQQNGKIHRAAKAVQTDKQAVRTRHPWLFDA
jgi:hypothetical protein